MKKLLLLAMLTVGTAQAQTSYKSNDITAAAGNEFETLLTNIQYGYNDATIQDCLAKMDFIKSDRKVNKIGTIGNFTARYEKQNAKNVFIYVTFEGKKTTGSLPLTTKVTIAGDILSIQKFYCNYWSREFDFNNVKPGEVVATRFLSDVATLSYPDGNTAKITVVSSKDR